MKPLFTEEELNLSKSSDLLPCECQYCKKTFYITRHTILDSLNPNRATRSDFCSNKCVGLSQELRITTKCTNCGKEFKKRLNQAKKSKSGNHFCSSSCAAIYNNTHKTKGTRRSKLEIYLENELRVLYPDLKIDFNQTNTINSELDIYIPSLNLAIELNGIFHYEPIFGQNKLNNIQNNDDRKFQACIEKGIELCIIDTSHEKYFKKQTSQKFLKIITEIINNKCN
jgi:hypothetical protein